jgi:hypothetical protein
MIAIEKLATNINQALPMMREHWIELYADTRPFIADIDGMVAQNENGDSIYFTLKEDGKLLAHMAYFVIKAPSYRAQIALDMFYYVKPEARGSMKCVRLLRESAKKLIESGISSVMVSRMNSVNIGLIIKRAGFSACGETFVFGG